MLHYGWYGMPGTGGWGFFPYGGWIMGILLVAILGVGLYAVLRNRKGSEAPSSMEILKRRLARGEISKEEYRELLKEMRE